MYKTTTKMSKIISQRETIKIRENLKRQGKVVVSLNGSFDLLHTGHIKSIEEAKKQGCYKLVGTSRHGRDKLHKWYEELGFKNYGLEFRINLL